MKPKHPPCPFCKSEETRSLTNYGRQVGNSYQCLSCRKWWCNVCKERHHSCKCEKEKV